jgi:hypothetical protein
MKKSIAGFTQSGVPGLQRGSRRFGSVFFAGQGGEGYFRGMSDCGSRRT